MGGIGLVLLPFNSFEDETNMYTTRVIANMYTFNSFEDETCTISSIKTVIM